MFLRPCSRLVFFSTYSFQLREFDRVRQLYQKYLEVCIYPSIPTKFRSLATPTQFDPSNSAAWIKYAELEAQLQDFARTRAIFKLGVTQSPLSMPELLWKAYIDFEIEEGERENARGLYETLVQQSGHVKVWISYALFEGEAIPVPRAEREEEEEEEEDEEAEVKMIPGDPAMARQVFERGYKDLKTRGLKSEVCLSLR